MNPVTDILNIIIIKIHYDQIRVSIHDCISDNRATSFGNLDDC
jgi:hypothetical protein